MSAAEEFIQDGPSLTIVKKREATPQSIADELQQYGERLAEKQNEVGRLEKTTMLSRDSLVVAGQRLIKELQTTITDIEMQKQLHEYWFSNLSFADYQTFNSLLKSFTELLAQVKKQLESITQPAPTAVSR